MSRTADWTDEDLLAYLDFCDACEIADVTVPMRVAAHESDNRAGAHNPDGDASGLWQMMPDTAKGLGWPQTDHALAGFRALSVKDQLVWWTRYYAPKAGKLGTVIRFYLDDFLPVELAHGDDPNFVVCGSRPGDPFPWAYKDNGAAFDVDHKGYIIAADLEKATVRATGPRTAELIGRVMAAKRLRDTQPDLAELGAEALDAVDVSVGEPEAPGPVGGGGVLGSGGSS